MTNKKKEERAYNGEDSSDDECWEEHGAECLRTCRNKIRPISVAHDDDIGERDRDELRDK